MAVSKKQKIVAAVLGALVVLYAVFGFYLLPYLIRTQLPGLMTEQTGHQTQLAAVRFNPFQFKLEMDGFNILAANSNPLIGFENFAVDFNAISSLTQQAFVFDSIVLQKPVVNVVREADGHLNLSSLRAKEPPSKAPAEKNDSLPSLMLRSFVINEGHIHWLDQLGGQQKDDSILPVNFSLTNLTTQNDAAGGFSLNLELASGGQLQLKGDLSLKPIGSKGHVSLENLELSKIWQLALADVLPVALTEGRLTLQTDYQLSLPVNGLSLSSSNGEVDLKKLSMAEKGQNDPLISIPAIGIHGISCDLDKHQIAVHSFSSDDAIIKASLQADGRVNYQRIFAQNADTAQPVTVSAPAVEDAKQAPLWQFTLGELALNNYQLLFSDQSRKQPQTMQLTGIYLELQKFGNPEGEKLPVKFTATLNQSGKFKIDGKLGLEPLNADIGISVNRIKLKDFQDYLEDYLKLELIDGEFNSHGNLQLTSAENMQLKFQGDANLGNLVTRDKILNKDFLKWSDLQFQQIDVDLAKQSYSIGKVFFDHPYARVTIEKDRATNIDQIIVNQASKPNPETKPKADSTGQSANQTNISIGKIQISQGNSDFTDYSLILPFLADMGDLNGEIDGFFSNQNTPIKLSLLGNVYNLAPVVIKGTYQIQSGNSDISLKFSHMPLPLITPYMADFAGYKIEKGQMSLDLQYKIDKGALTAQNKIFIDQLELGDQVENPHATSLPLHFAIALLKDADGKINLDFPITGSLNDPQFSVGALIADVLGNLINKLVTSPFKALGSLLSDDQDYSTVSFNPGDSELKPEEAAKLDQLAKAMQNKPELTLDVKGVTYEAQDWPVMRFDALKEILKKMKSGELRDKGQQIRSEYIEISDDEYKRLLAKFFKEVFPLEYDVSFTGSPRIKSQPDADFYPAARQKLEAVMQPDPQRLNDLAIARANTISKYLADKGGLDIGRIYLLAPELNATDSNGINSILSLNAAH